MKSLTLVSILIVLYMGFGISSISIPELNAPEITFGKLVSQNCPEDLTSNAEVVFLQLVAVEHPLGPNTCGDLHSIDLAGIEGSESSVNIRFLED